MTREASLEQLRAIMDLNEGDKVKLTNGDIAEFVKAKQKKFIGIINGSRYDIPMVMFVEVIEKIDINKLMEDKQNEAQQKKDESNQILKSLKRGDWFYIIKNDDALLFKFEGIEGKKIIGINPVSNRKTKIDMTFNLGKVI